MKTKNVTHKNVQINALHMFKTRHNNVPSFVKIFFPLVNILLDILVSDEGNH